MSDKPEKLRAALTEVLGSDEQTEKVLDAAAEAGFFFVPREELTKLAERLDKTFETDYYTTRLLNAMR
jgi:hypothetical protein